MSWSEVPLGELSRIKTGKLDANASSPDGAYPFFTCAKEPLRIASYSYDCECVLVAGNGDLNVKHYSGKFDAYQRTYIIESADPKRLNVRYLFHFMDQYLDVLREQSIGGIIKYIKMGNLTEAPIPLPPLPEQRRIAAILDKADALRAKRRLAIAKLDQLLQSVFLEMFGDPVTNPKGWRKSSLNSICRAIVDCPHTTPNWTEEGVVCLRTSNLTKGGWDWSDKRFVTDDEYQERSKRSEACPGDIILSREGTVGVAAIVEPGMRVCMGQRLVQVRPDLNATHPSFLLQLLLYDLAPDRIERLMVGSTAKHLNVKDLRDLKIFVPPIALQRKFADVASRLKKEMINMCRSIDQMDGLSAGLQSRLFSGPQLTAA